MMNSCSGYAPCKHYQIIFTEKHCPLCAALKDCAHIETEVIGLRAKALALHVDVREDGTWLAFAAPQSPTASIRLESMSEDRRGIVGLAINAFIKFARSKQ